MKESKPKFVLTSVYSDGSEEAPEIVSLSQAINESKMNRRGFLGAGMTAAAALVFLNGCEEKEPEVQYSQVYSMKDETGKIVTYTLPCGSPIPPGATCICDCVPGEVCTCDSHCTCNSQCSCVSNNSSCQCHSVGTCQCNQVCTCNKVCTVT